MVVVSLTDCPPKVRGDMTKWLFEINTGVYVGKVSARVREELWERICKALSRGKATMVYNADNEQGLEFKVHNTTWVPVDFDGVKLMLRPAVCDKSDSCNKFGKAEHGFSKAAEYAKLRRIRSAKQRQAGGYVVVDVETDGLSFRENNIIEIAAVHVADRKIVRRFEALINTGKTLPQNIQKLTGITPEMLEEEGVELCEAIRQFADFIGGRALVFHNAEFDMGFLEAACRKCGAAEFKSPYKDTLVLAKRKLDEVENYKLNTLAQYFGAELRQKHRALNDCELTFFVYEKLNEM